MSVHSSGALALHKQLCGAAATEVPTGMTVNEFYLLKALIQTLQIMVDTMQNRITALP